MPLLSFVRVEEAMASRMTPSSEGWFQFPNAALADNVRVQEQAVKEAVRLLAEKDMHKAGVFCFLRPPLGGPAMAFAR